MIAVKISALGNSSFEEVLESILFFWNLKIFSDFIFIVENTKNQLKLNPNLGKPFLKNIRKIVLHKNASMFYEYHEVKQIITILLFIDNRQNPSDYLKLL